MAGSIFAETGKGAKGTRAAATKLKVDAYKTIHEEIKGVRGTFGEYAADYIKRNNVTRYNFKEKTRLDDSTFSRLQNAEDRNWQLSTILSFRVGFNLHQLVALRILAVAGFPLGKTPTVDKYCCLLTDMGGKTIDEWNDELPSHGLPLLGSKEKASPKTSKIKSKSK